MAFNIFKRKPEPSLSEQMKDAQRWYEEREAYYREQMRLAAKVDEHSEILREHDERIAKNEKRIAELEFRMAQAEADIEHWQQAASALYALLDVEQAEQAAALPGSKTDIKCQKKIITLNNQIHAAESRIRKAQFIHSTAKKELAQ